MNGYDRHYEDVTEGCRVLVHWNGDENEYSRWKWALMLASEDAEVVSVRKHDDGLRFYVHYIGCNRRLDEWVAAERLDLGSLRKPTKGQKGLALRLAEQPQRYAMAFAQ